MNRTYRSLPKTELHLHLEGSIEPETLHELDPTTTVEEARQRYRYRNFPEFIESYLWAIRHLKEPKHWGIVTRRLLERLHRENVRYAEITLSVAVVLWRKEEFEPIFAAVQAEAERSPVQVRWVFDSTRQWGVDAALEVLKLALAHKEDGVVAFGIGGNEVLGPVEWFADVFRQALDGGLHLTIHAGETVGPESVWGALKLGAERIGHGTTAAQDPVLLAYLKERRIPLEVCVSSNVATGSVACLAEHPIRKIHDAGVPIVLGSDDPAMFHTTLEREYDLAADEFGFTGEELAGIVENGFKYAFDAVDSR